MHRTETVNTMNTMNTMNTTDKREARCSTEYLIWRLGSRRSHWHWHWHRLPFIGIPYQQRAVEPSHISKRKYSKFQHIPPPKVQPRTNILPIGFISDTRPDMLFRCSLNLLEKQKPADNFGFSRRATEFQLLSDACKVLAATKLSLGRRKRHEMKR